MLDEIDYSNLRVIGAGKFAICLTDGTYAIKIGKISFGDAAQMSHSGKFSVPVYYYQERLLIPARIISALDKIPINGTYMPLSYYEKKGYIRNGFAAILVCGLATPIVSHDVDLDDDIPVKECKRLYAICQRLAARYKKVIGYSWTDVHPYNVGRYQGRYVILDF